MPRDQGTPDKAPSSVPVGERAIPARLAAELLERISDSFIALDCEWRIVYMNKAAMTMGRPVSPDVIGRSHWDVWPETRGTEVERQYRTAMETQRPVHFEHHYVIPGADFWHSVHAYPDETGLSIFFRDVTEQKRADQLARILATASSKLVSTLDQDAIMRVVSAMALPLLGAWACVYLVDEQFHVTAVDATAVDERQHAILRQVVAQLPVAATDVRLPWNRAMHHQEAVLLSPVDDEFHDALGRAELRDFVMALAPRSLVCVPLVARGRVIGGITFGAASTGRAHDRQDLLAAREVALPAGLALDTARVYEEQLRANREADDARRRAEAANNARVEFLRAMSHELRTPLNAIGGYVQLLLMGARGELPATVRADLERLERNQQQVNHLITDVLSFTKLEMGRIEYDRRPVALRAILESLEDLVGPHREARTHSLVVRECDETTTVFADSGKAAQILVNLISNAFKHTPRGTPIEVFQKEERGRDPFVRICVRDGGPGIAPDQIDLIFEPFVQVGKSLSHPVDGLGLGLSIARDLARGMDGDLTAESTPGEGTTFILALPRR